MPSRTHSICLWLGETERKWLSFTEALAGSQEFFLERLGYGAQESAGVNSVAWSNFFLVGHNYKHIIWVSDKISGWTE